MKFRNVKKPKILRHADWHADGAQEFWHGSIQGTDMGTGAGLILFTATDVGDGPVWHVHPYDEIFIVTEGNALFTIGDEKIEATTGDILIGPANVPHKYKNIGPGKLVSTDIHISPKWIQTDLFDPEVEN